jgi:putative transposase
LQAKLEDLQDAYQKFFKRRGGYPRFKSRKHEQKIRYPQGFKIDKVTGRVYLPKIGWVKAIFHRPLEGTMKSITVSKTKSGKYFISVLCEIEKSNQPHGKGVVGVDLGLKHFAILSTGEKIDTPQYLRRAEWKLKFLQRRLSRKKKGSANREKARIRIARQHEKIANQRKDFLDRVSFKLARDYHTIKLENLNVLGMVKNHRLAKSIQDSGWGLFGEMLGYKAANLEKIDRFYPSSKMCSTCGYKNETLQLQHRFWKCPQCGTEHDRDINAAQNILTAPTVGSTGR